MNTITKKLQGKNIAIVGFGKEGESSYNFIRKDLKKEVITIVSDKLDENVIKKIKAKDNNVEFVIGEGYLKNLDRYDLIIKSPGVSLKNEDTTKYIQKVTSQLELFLENTKGYTIGITGTKGKSTTSTLIYKILKEQNKKVALIGNIGVPVLEEFEKIQEDTIAVIEMSSHALEYTKKSPNIALMLNIFEEHLDYYKSFENYKQAKFNIFKYQDKKDYTIFNLDNKEIQKVQFSYNENSYAVTFENNSNYISKNTISKDNEKILINGLEVYKSNAKRNLKGNHNLNNIMFVLAVANILKLDLEKTVNTINNFQPLEHRLEFVANIDNVDYYNDSIATIPESTIESVKALENVTTLIVGGNDRGVNLLELIQFIKENEILENIICLPKTGEYIFESLKKSNKNVYMTQNMEEAVKISKEKTRKDTICLLSPAASSYGYYKNFIERGNLFKKYVLEEKEK